MVSFVFYSRTNMTNRIPYRGMQLFHFLKPFSYYMAQMEEADTATGPKCAAAAHPSPPHRSGEGGRVHGAPPNAFPRLAHSSRSPLHPCTLWISLCPTSPQSHSLTVGVSISSPPTPMSLPPPPSRLGRCWVADWQLVRYWSIMAC